MVQKRAEDRTFHFTYRVTCTKTEKVFYGLHSTDDLSVKFEGKGTALFMSFKNHGRDVHTLKVMHQYPSRTNAKVAYNLLKASQLLNPVLAENKKFHLVYKTTRFDGKYYIGVHSTDDLNDGYKGSGTHLTRSLKKHGDTKHIREILELCETRDVAFAQEKNIVNEELLKDPQCMNSVSGGRHHGNRVYGVTEETRAKLSKHFKTIVRTPEWKAKISAAHMGKKMSNEAIQNRLSTLKERGYKPSKEACEAQRQGQLSSDKFKKCYRPMIINGVTYQNGREAVAALGIPGSTLSYRLKSPNWLEYRHLDTSEKMGAEVSARARGEYIRVLNSL